MTAVWAVTMVRNEPWAHLTVRHLIGEGVDGVVVVDHLSDDDTGPRCAAEALPGVPVEVIRWEDPGYYQARIMTHAAGRARALAGTPDLWIVPYDADELWTGPGGLADTLRACDAPAVDGRIYNHWQTALDPPVDPCPFTGMPWCEPTPQPLGKVAVRWQDGLQIRQGNHTAADVNGNTIPAVDIGVRIDHFPYWGGADRFIAKAVQGAAAYAATDLPADTGRHWREYGATAAEHGPEALAAHWRAHFFYDDPEAAGLVRRW